MAWETAERFLMLRSSFSLAWSSLGQLWKTRQPFSHKLLHSANQIEVLDKLLFSSVPAAIGGEKQPITHKQVQPQPFLYLPGMSQGADGAGGGEGWGGLDANTSICMASACPSPAADPTVRPCKTLRTCKITLLPRRSAFLKMNRHC